MGHEAPVIGTDDPHLLQLAAGGYAPAAQNALGVVPHQVQGGVLNPGQQLIVGVAHRINAQVSGQLTQLALGIAGAGQAVHAVVGQDQFQGELPGVADLGGVGTYHHALAHRVDAGGHQAPGALHLHHADAAGTDLVDVLQKAQGGDLDTCIPCGLQHRGPGRDGDRDVVDCQVDHFLFHVRHALPQCLLTASKRQLDWHRPHLMHLF